MQPNTLRRSLLSLTLPLGAGLLLVAQPSARPTPPAPGSPGDPCSHSALEALMGCRRAAASDYWIARANCTNLPAGERLACQIDALLELREASEECWDVHEARLDVCDDLGGGIYDPQIDPDDFVAVIDNPFLPLLPGVTLTYEMEDDGETEVIVVSVLNETREILGVECTVVRDTVSVDGELVEDTHDWFAQDKWGNVWYFGEISVNYEDGEISDVEGSWEAGEDGAKPGIVMPAAPQVGEVYRQEYLIAEAEDVGAVVALNQSVSVPYGSFTGCLQTADYTPLEPDTLEHKFYAPGLGLVLEVDLEDGTRVELVSVTN
jgi:hypothetical protein